MENIVILLHSFLCIVLSWSAWCRLVKMDERRTRPSIRLAFTLSGMGPVALLIAPWGSELWDWFPIYRPHPVVILVLLGYAAVQVSTSRHWRTGPPPSFCKEQT
jgi:hypothetical protein